MEGYGNENPGAFQSTRPLRGATSQPITKVERLGEFQPTRPLRGATPQSAFTCCVSVFQPTRPLRGATKRNRRQIRKQRDFNPRAPCGARHDTRDGNENKDKEFQPTRPLRGATRHRPQKRPERLISTHAPLAGRDCIAMEHRPEGGQFQPTRPLRGATTIIKTWVDSDGDFNPRAPCGARQELKGKKIMDTLFQPTRPLRGATAKEYKSLCTFLR